MRKTETFSLDVAQDQSQPYQRMRRVTQPDRRAFTRRLMELELRTRPDDYADQHAPTDVVHVPGEPESYMERDRR